METTQAPEAVLLLAQEKNRPSALGVINVVPRSVGTLAKAQVIVPRATERWVREVHAASKTMAKINLSAKM